MQFCPACGVRLSHAPPVTCLDCGVRHWRNAKPCAGALATRDGHLLLVRRAHDPWLGCWDIPGGFCEVDEHPMRAAAREVQEETGLEVDVTGFLGIWLDDYPDPVDATGALTLNVYYHAVVVGGVEHPQAGEVAELGWFDPGGIPDQIAFPNHAADTLAAWQRQFSAGETRSVLPDRPG